MTRSMPFSTPEQVQASREFLNKMDIPVCKGCSSGIGMCYHTPCMGTPEDMEKLLDAGYANDIMMDWWLGASTLKNHEMAKKMNFEVPIENPFSEDVIYLAPAIKGYGGGKTPLGKKGTCGFLKDNLCSLHDKGLKPLQGKIACCSIKRVFKGESEDLDERLYLLYAWNTEKGRQVVDRWKKLVNFDEKYKDEKLETPKTSLQMLEFLIDFMGKMSEKPDIPEDPNFVDREYTTIEYEKPKI